MLTRPTNIKRLFGDLVLPVVRLSQIHQFAMLVAPAAERNKHYILEVLRSRGVGARPGFALELASGSGQHVTLFASNLPHVVWQPSDIEAASLASISAYVKSSGLPNLLPPLCLDVRRPLQEWPGGPWPKSCDLVLSINLVHISPFTCTQGLFKAAQDLLKPSALLVTYGPYAINGTISPQSNVDFDASLRRSNPDWGLRDVTILKELAKEHHLEFLEMVDMPANNKCLVFRMQ
uniref:methyltransferase-like 26 n=1 Tax=Myxine glutinosa TaxID=7769 RepID=UPI00358FD2E9